jgi:hypothetical protein
MNDKAVAIMTPADYFFVFFALNDAKGYLEYVIGFHEKATDTDVMLATDHSKKFKIIIKTIFYACVGQTI